MVTDEPTAETVDLTPDEWMAEVHVWVASFPQVGHVVDDSREAIYGDRC